MPSLESRRDFLRVAAGTAGAAALGLSRLAPAAEPKPPFNIGIQMFSLRGYPVDVALQHAKDIGFQKIEFYTRMFDQKSTPDQIEAMKKQLAALGCSISAHGVNKITKDEATSRQLFAFCKLAGIRNIVADPDLDSFDLMDKLVGEYDIRVAIHNHGPKHRYNKGIDVANAIRNHDNRIGACADLGHYIRSGENPVEIIRLFEGRLYGIHLKDFATAEDVTKGTILGEGLMDVPAVFRALRQVNFPADAGLSLEYEENKDNPLADLRACLAAAKKAAAEAS